MKKSKTIFIMSLIEIIILLSSCVSNRADKDSVMYAMVYDYESNKVQGARLLINEKLIGESDVHGHIMFVLKEKKEYTAELRKSGYRTEQITFRYEPSQVLYFKLGNAIQFTTLAEELLDSKRFEDALRYTDYALELDETKADALYLKAIILNKMERFEESNICLSKIKRRKSNETCISTLEKLNSGRTAL